MKTYWIMKIPSLILDMQMTDRFIFENLKDEERLFTNYVNKQIVDSKRDINFWESQKNSENMVKYSQKELDYWIFVREYKLYRTEEIWLNDK